MMCIKFVVIVTHHFTIQNRNSNHKTSLPHFSGYSIRKCWLRLVIACIIVSTGCTPENEEKVRELASALARQEFTLTALTINLAGTHEITEKCADDILVGCAHQTVPWVDRADRIAKWIGDNSSQFHDRKVPDIITLQEVYGYEGCQSWFGSELFGGFRRLPDYEVLLTLISKVEAQTGVRYRIAYWGVWESCGAWAGKALLYNSNFLSNEPPVAPENTIWEYDNPNAAAGFHIRESFVCSNPPVIGFDDPCSLIDGTGKFWTYLRFRSNRPWQIDPIFVRLRFKNSSDSYIHIYNVHVDVFDYDNSFAAVDSLATTMETRYTEKLVYPPILMGDFNVNSEGEALALWPRFEVAGWSGTMGILVGKRDSFSSSFPAYSKPLILPNRGTNNEPSCGEIEHLWSDHCAVFVEFSPVPP